MNNTPFSEPILRIGKAVSFQKLFSASIALAGGCFLLSSCTTHVDMIGLAQEVARQHARPTSESEWNRNNNWKRIADNPPTYVPIDYAVDGPFTEKDGKWLTDKRDGKKLFVPFIKAGPMEPGVALGEAKKITNHIKKESHIYTRPGILLNGG